MEVQSMKLENTSLRLRHNVQRVSGAIDHWCAGNSFFYADSFHRLRWNAWAKIFLPESVRAKAVSVKGIDGIVFSCYEHHVVRAACNIAQARDKQRLGIDLAVYRIRELLTKRCNIDVGRIQNGF